MNRSDNARSIRSHGRETDLPRKTVRQALACPSSSLRAVLDGEVVNLTGLGTFDVRIETPFSPVCRFPSPEGFSAHTGFLPFFSGPVGDLPSLSPWTRAFWSGSPFTRAVSPVPELPGYREGKGPLPNRQEDPKDRKTAQAPPFSSRRTRKIFPGWWRPEVRGPGRPASG